MTEEDLEDGVLGPPAEARGPFHRTRGGEQASVSVVCCLTWVASRGFFGAGRLTVRPCIHIMDSNK